jgi:hypothetical protein
MINGASVTAAVGVLVAVAWVVASVATTRNV